MAVDTYLRGYQPTATASDSAHFTSRPHLHPNTDKTKELSSGDGAIPSVPPSSSEQLVGDEPPPAAARSPADPQVSPSTPPAVGGALAETKSRVDEVELEVDEYGNSDEDYMDELLDDLVELVKDRDTDLGTQAVWEKFPDKARQRILVHEGPVE